MMTLRRHRARGASMVEFLVVAPLLALMGLGTLQAGLAYHGRTVLNYATFEAARTGATHHALSGPMRRELAGRLAPLVGGDGTGEAAASALGASLLRIPGDGTFTRLRIVNPSTEAFDHFSIRSRESGKDAIPNSHLRFRTDAQAGVDAVSGVDLRDANLLRIEVTHGFDMKVPLMGTLAAPLLTLYDPSNAHYYAAGKLPLTSVATVRMQSEVWRDSLVSMKPAPPGGAQAPGESTADPDAIAGSSAPDGSRPTDIDTDADADAGPDDTDPADPDSNAGCPEPADGGDPFLPVLDAETCSVPPGEADGPSSSPLPDAPAGQPQPGAC